MHRTEDILNYVYEPERDFLGRIEPEYVLDEEWERAMELPQFSKEQIAFSIGMTYFENGIHVNPYPYPNSESKAWSDGYQYAKCPKKTFTNWLGGFKKHLEPKVTKEEIAYKIGQLHFKTNKSINPYYPDWQCEASAWDRGYGDASKGLNYSL